MVKYQSVDETFAALSDPTRRAVVERLTSGPASVSQLAEPFGISLPGMLKHLRALEDAGLITTGKQGRTRICTLEAEPIKEAEDWLEQRRRTWERRLDRLDRHLQREGT